MLSGIARWGRSFIECAMLARTCGEGWLRAPIRASLSLTYFGAAKRHKKLEMKFAGAADACHARL